VKTQPAKYHHVNALWRVPVTWRTTYDWNRVKLSATMENTLRAAVEAGAVRYGSRRSLQALEERGLVDGDRLTPEGWVFAITLLSLPKQCELLGIPLKVLRLPSGQKPEIAVLREIAKLGRKVAYCEGGAITLLLYCLCFERLYQLSTQYWGSEAAARSYMYTGIVSYSYLLEQYPNLMEDMLTDVANANEPSVLRAFAILKSWQGSSDGWAFRDWIGVNRELIRQLFWALGNTRCAALARRYLADPYAYSKGWPYLVCIDGETVGLSEVKTTDRLHWSQVITTPEMCEVGDLVVEVVQVRWSDAR
jgi:hypothetical protein